MVNLRYSLLEAENMTLREYSYEMYAWNLREIEVQRKLDLLAWQSQIVTAEKKQGKKVVPYYRTFEEFTQTKKMADDFNKNYGLDKISKMTTKEKDLISLLKEANK